MMLPKLVSLNLDFNENFNKKGCAYSGDIYLQLSHGQFLHLEELSLNHCNIACGSYDILKLIQICPGLVSLNLDNNGLNEEWMKRLSQALRHCPDLAYLNLNDNYINAEGTMYIGDLLNSHKLVSLELSSTKIGDKGLSNITNVLCSNLTNLDLSANMIGEEGATNIANALRDAQFPNLTNLCLKWNKIEDVGASNIINAQWSSLTCLDLSYNEIVERKRLKVLQLHCPSLKELILSLRRGCNKYCKCTKCCTISYTKKIDLLFD
jgi:Ran GTPase-activating protein (RanGAP) involved in mRNA processing and transport